MNKPVGKKWLDSALAISLPKWLGERLLIAFYALIALTLMVMTNSRDSLIYEGQMAVADITAPIFSTLSKPVHAVSQRIYDVNGLRDLAAENERLKKENRSLKQWQYQAKQLMTENRQLKKLTALESLPRARYRTARLIADTGGSYSHTIMIDQGLNQGIDTGHAALTVDGLAGIVIGAGDNTARVLLLNDINARIPVVTEKTRQAAILSGTNGQRLHLKYLNENATVESGERLVTSGRGGLLAPGIPVAYLVHQGNDQQSSPPYALPLVDLARTEYLQIIDFGRKTMAGQF
mgnify:CR=1 FL=1